ncbi:UDP-glycosyltransferase TURAN [Ditylenchus destructor]|nr:UDP-glycosyltransferase TURAN [Ditylenchus destructor]
MPHGISRHGKQVGMLNNAMVVIMGDIEGNPRMCYHALSLADNGFSVDLIGYAGTEPHNRILTHPKIRLIHLRPTPDAMLRFFPSPIALLTKYLWILFFLFITLLFHTKDCVKLTITQNPPGAIAMFICWMAAKLKHSALIIDWNNYSSTLLRESDVNEIKQSAGKGLFASMGEVAEKCFGKTADWNLCASRTIQKGLRRRLGIKTFTTVYNKVPSWGYRSLSTEEKHIFLARMMKTPDFTHVTASKHWPTNEDGSLFFHKTPCGKMELLDNRPLLIVIPTCLTLSEDFGSLLEALEGYEKHARSDIRQSADETKSLPKLLVAIIGKGSLKNFYLERIAKMDMQYVHIVITWLTAEDYPQFLACADLGVSLRTSSPGVDMSMKVADMIGCHLPVLAKKNDAIGELVVDSFNGMFFDTSHELKQQLIELATGFPKFSQALNKIKDNRKSQPQSTWEEEWNAAVMPLIPFSPLAIEIARKLMVKTDLKFKPKTDLKSGILP